MGKDLKGKELGLGISQRANGLYTARFTNRFGKRVQKYFRKLQECKQWLADAQYEDEHGNVLFGDMPTVDAWFQYWIDNIKGNNIGENTKDFYCERYEKNIKSYIGQFLLDEVLPLHCQNVLNQMSSHYSNSVIRKTRLVMHMLFDSAVENELIIKNPVKKSVQCKSGKPEKHMRALTVEEQKLFLSAVSDSIYYNQWAFILQTGLRTGEMVGLRWSDIDFEKRTFQVRRTMEYKKKQWRIHNPKTEKGLREIPLTDEAVAILKDQKRKNSRIKVIPYEFKDMVFLDDNGEPPFSQNYNKNLYYYCDTLQIDRFSMHVLRHTFATRCIESGMRPKTLQIILGHSKLSMTMDLYVHVTDDERTKEMKRVEQQLKVV